MKDRIYGFQNSAALNVGFELIPKAIRPLCACHALIGKDPIAYGLHSFDEATYGRSHRETMHVCYPWHLDSRFGIHDLPVLVVPPPEEQIPAHIVHELGHALHFNLGYPDVVRRAVSWYAATDFYEMFAEAFTSWIVPGYAERPDDEAIAFFEQLLTIRA